MDHDHASTPVSSPAQPTHPEPIRERFSSIDTLRGFALMGILVPNIWFFAWPMIAATSPDEIMSPTRANHLAHDITSILFLGKFMFLFALLFGSGVVMYGRKFDTADEHNQYHTKLSTGWKLWHTRCAVLLGFGLIHAYLFWFGDILTFYAVAGLTLLWWVRRLNPKLQLWGGLALYFFGAMLMVGFTLLGYWAFSTGQITVDELSADPEAELQGYLGTFIDAFRVRFFTTLTFQLMFVVFFTPALWGIMTMGMGLTRMGYLTGSKPTKHYAMLAALLIPIGLALTGLAYYTTQTAFDPIPGFIWQSFAQPVGVPLAFGYAALVIALSKCAWAKLVTVPLAAVGRMALTNYFTHTLLCTTFFYGYGLGYFAQIEFPRLWLVVLGVWAINITFSLLWLRAFKMGPFEWLWRCLTYRRLVPIR